MEDLQGVRDEILTSSEHSKAEVGLPLTVMGDLDLRIRQIMEDANAHEDLTDKKPKYS